MTHTTGILLEYRYVTKSFRSTSCVWFKTRRVNKTKYFPPLNIDYKFAMESLYLILVYI